MTMKKGEQALVTIEPEYAFGSSESQQELAVVPPGSTVHYEVELVSFVKVGEDDKEIHFAFNHLKRFILILLVEGMC